MLLPDLTRKKSLKERVLFWTVIVLLAAMILSAKPLYQAVKKRRAASLAQQGELLLSQQKGDEALAKLQSALQMDPENLQANYGLARLLTYSRRPEAFRFWETVFAKGGGNLYKYYISGIHVIDSNNQGNFYRLVSGNYEVSAMDQNSKCRTDVKEVLISQPDSGEQAFEITE